HAGEHGVAGEVPGQEGLVAGDPVAGHDALAGHQLVDGVDEPERRPVGQQPDRVAGGPVGVGRRRRRHPAPTSVAAGAPAPPPAAASSDARASAGDRAIAWAPPSTWTISPVVAGNQSDSSATQARATGSGSRTSQPRGARLAQASSMASKWGMERAASVRSGPAATRLTRTRRGPRSRAR